MIAQVSRIILTEAIEKRLEENFQIPLPVISSQKMYIVKQHANPFYASVHEASISPWAQLGNNLMFPTDYHILNIQVITNFYFYEPSIIFLETAIKLVTEIVDFQKFYL